MWVVRISQRTSSGPLPVDRSRRGLGLRVGGGSRPGRPSAWNDARCATTSAGSSTQGERRAARPRAAAVPAAPLPVVRPSEHHPVRRRTLPRRRPSPEGRQGDVAHRVHCARQTVTPTDRRGRGATQGIESLVELSRVSKLGCVHLLRSECPLHAGSDLDGWLALDQPTLYCCCQNLTSDLALPLI